MNQSRLISTALSALITPSGVSDEDTAHLALVKSSIKAGNKFQKAWDATRPVAVAMAERVRAIGPVLRQTPHFDWQASYEERSRQLLAERPGITLDERVLLSSTHASLSQTSDAAALAKFAAKAMKRAARLAKKQAKRARKVGETVKVGPVGGQVKAPIVDGSRAVSITTKPGRNPVVDSAAVQKQIQNSDRDAQANLERWRDKALRKGLSLQEAVLYAHDRQNRSTREAIISTVLTSERDARLLAAGNIR
jgi:hypothetical protein